MRPTHRLVFITGNLAKRATIPEYCHRVTTWQPPHILSRAHHLALATHRRAFGNVIPVNPRGGFPTNDDNGIVMRRLRRYRRVQLDNVVGVL